MPLQKSYSEQNGSLRVSPSRRQSCDSGQDRTSHTSRSTQYQTRQQWHRSSSASAVPGPNAPLRPLAPISDVTRNKLSKFQFREDVMGDETSAFPGIRSGVAMATTTATVTAATTVNTTSTDAKKDDGIVHDNKENANPSSPPAAPTSTPKNGIAWKDLLSDHHNSSHNANGSNDGVTAVGGTLDALHGPNGVRDHIATVSPEDRVLWDSRMDAVWAATTPAQNASRRRAAGGRKRVRSSSPTSSPSYNNGTDGDGAGAAVNVQGTTALQTPKADPALELWDRFSTVGPGAGTGADVLATPTKRGGGVPGRLLSTLMSASSPRPAAKMGLTAGTASQQRAEGLDRGSGLILRRAISCGAQWPKRRRLIGGGDGGQVVAMAGVEGDSPSSAAVKDSMVKALLQTVNGEIEMRGAAAVARPDMKDVSVSVAAAREGQQPPAPRLDERWPGEAPLLERYAVTDSDQGLPDVQMVDPGRPPQTGAPGPSGPPGPQPVTSDGTLVGQDSDDYGDLDLDDEALLELDASIDMGMVMDHDGTVVAKKAPPPVVKATAAPAAKPALSEDEFEDIDDDVFAAAEHLIAEMDTQATRAPDPAGRQGPHVEGDGDAYGDDFGDDFDFEAAEKAATQTAGHPGPSSLAASGPSAGIIQRYLVTKVFDGLYVDDHGRRLPEKVLVVEADRTKAVHTIHLRDDWIDTPVVVKAYVHVIGEFEPSVPPTASASTPGGGRRCIVDNFRNILILHPDQLISATVVADSFSCLRRAVLQDRVKATGDTSAPLVYGTLLHEVFQEALLANRFDVKFLDDVISAAVSRHVEDLYVVRIPMSDAREHLRVKIAPLLSWAATFVASQPQAGAIVQGRNGEKSTMCINKLLDVEEHVWSPKYGLKGNIDATVQVRMRQGDTERTLTVPFELKTGRKATNHQAQTALYNLLLSDRYDIEIAYGVLHYLESSDTMLVPTVRHELRHMIMQRNRLACHVRERSVQLPPMKKSQALCGRCYAKVGCFIYHRLADDGDGETSGMRAEFDEVVGHLKPSHRDFFLKWEELLTKEEKESWKLRRELWTMAGSERERLGRCFADVVIEPGSASVDPAVAGKVNRFRYTFIRENPPPGFSFLESQLVVGEPIVVSDEQGHFALALGYVTAASRSRLTVAVDRRLHNARIRGPGFDEHDNQTFAGIMDVLPGGSAPDLSQARATVPAVRYRVDKDEFSNGMAMVRNNLIQVMADGSSASRQIRRLVVDLAPPRFKSEPARCATAAASSDEKDGDLNEDQSRAVDKVMSALDYALVLGMPGTGKTTTIAHIIRALVRQGRSVLLASYTHTAVDNILLKLRNDTIPILRLGAVAKVHADVRGFATLAAAASFSSQMSSLEAVREAWHSPPVVATTCLGIGHPLFAERTFDVCIVDEASQITLPVCLGPIRMARAFVLVGDHNQLPPLVQNDEARKGGLDVSLFKLLSDAHPDAVVSLEHQYRMCEPIMLLSNTLIYGGRLKCGTEALRDRRLDVPDLDGGMAALHHHRTQTCSHHVGNARMEAPKASHVRCWLRDLVDGAAQVRFVNTDTLVLPSSQPPSSTAAMAGVAEPGAREEARGNRIVNRGEARVVAQLVAALVACGVPSDEIGVLTHYRSQLSLLRHAISRIQIPARSGSQQCVGSGNVGLGSGIEMHTADRFQGRDKEVVVVSLVRSNGALGQIGDLLKDWRRINVAFTRAKTKLLVVGSRETLKASAVATAKREQEPAADSSRHGPSDDDGRGDDMLARFVALMEDRNWVYDLPPDALDCGHAIDEAGDAATQATLRIVSPKKEAAMAAATAMSIPPLAAEAAFRRIGDMEDFTVAIDRERSAAAKVDATETRPTAGLKSPSKRFGSSVARFTDKENSIVRERVRDENSKAATRVPLKKATADKRVLLKGRPVLRDILNEMMDGQY